MKLSNLINIEKKILYAVPGYFGGDAFSYTYHISDRL